MPLPAALAARLAKRGLLAKKFEEERREEEEEEVIAEDYDDGDKASSETVYDSRVYPTVAGCPHKANIYHTCSLYCVRNYCDVPKEPSRGLRRKFDRILKDFPLEGDWQKVYEPGLKTFYFWNTETDQVSWWPATHPSFKISMPAEKLRKMLLKDKEAENEKKEGSAKSQSDDEDDDESDDDSDESSYSSEEEETSHARREVPGTNKRHKPTVVGRNSLDPMDPAAYSNIPRGKWSDGLNEARKG